MALWVVELQMKTFPIFVVKKSGSNPSFPSTTIFNCSQNVLEDCFWTYLTLQIQLCSVFLCTSLGLCAASENVSPWWVAENSENLKSNLKFLNAVWSKPYTVALAWLALLLAPRRHYEDERCDPTINRTYDLLSCLCHILKSVKSPSGLKPSLSAVPIKMSFQNS
jgi:hypothetical protein